MPRPRKTESAYERRIRRYLEAHPGATRQEARGHRPGEYRRRIERYQARHPGASLRQASGHAGRFGLVAEIRPGDLVAVTSAQRDSGGRLTEIEFWNADRDHDYHIDVTGWSQADLDELADMIVEAGAYLAPSAYFNPSTVARAA